MTLNLQIYHLLNISRKWDNLKILGGLIGIREAGRRTEYSIPNFQLPKSNGSLAILHLKIGSWDLVIGN